MFQLYGTDTPLYHYPIVTITVVAVNMVVHTLIQSMGADPSEYYLPLGEGITPLQWLTANFLHGGTLNGWPQLIGNLLFILLLGTIAEGKVGWLRMLALILVIAIGSASIQQIMMLSVEPSDAAAEMVAMFDDPDNPLSDEEKKELRDQWRSDLEFGGASMGSSAIVFGLLALCAIWAPVGQSRSFSLLWIAMAYFVKEFGFFFWIGGSFNTQSLNLIGLVLGGGFGLGLLMLGQVKTDSYDVISLLSEDDQEELIAEQIERDNVEAQRLANLAHQNQSTVQAQPVVKPAVVIVPERMKPKPVAVPIEPNPVAEVSSAGTPTESNFGVDLPDFDDGVVTVDPREQMQREIDQMVVQGDFLGAVRHLAKVRTKVQSFMVTPNLVDRLSKGLVAGGSTMPALRVLELAAKAYPAQSPRYLLRAADIELNIRGEPIAAIKRLREIDRGLLDSSSKPVYMKLAAQAKRAAGG